MTRLTSLLPAILGTFGFLCQAPASEPIFPIVQQTAEWTTGPATNRVGTVAQIRIPQGYKFTDAQGARLIMERMKNPIPKGLAGIMAPDVGAWWIVFQYNETGYVKHDDKERLDAEAILKSIEEQVARQNTDRAKQGLAPISSVGWELKPAYDATDHTLEWAVRAQSVPEASNGVSVVNQTVRFLGRHGMLDAIAVRPYKGFSDLAPLKQLVRGIAFEEGERYGDYTEGDKISAIGLAESIGTDNGTEPAQAVEPAATPESTQPRSLLALWIGLGIVVCVGAIIGVLVALKPRSRQPREATEIVSTPIQAERPTLIASDASTPPPTQPATPSATPAPRPRPAFAEKAAESKRSGAHRHRAFDYNKYFGDLMSSVSSHGLPEANPANSYENDLNRLAAGGLSSASGANAGPNGMFQANAELIANQTTFIEEQRRLIQEQTRLIEEKSKLIAEKNHLIKLQSELMENKLL